MASKEAPKKKKNLHEGHRARMRKRFKENGLDGWSQHEMLEFLLFYVHGQCNTNEIGHELIDRFGSLRGVLDADYAELITVPHIGDRAAVLLKLLPQLFRVYMTEGSEKQSLLDYAVRKAYFQQRLCIETNEILLAACLDDEYNVYSCEKVASGIVSRTDVQMNQLMRAVLQSNCSLVMLAHNHPRGTALPSDADIAATRQIAGALQTVGVTLTDHIIIAGNQVISMEETGYFESNIHR